MEYGRCRMQAEICKRYNSRIMPALVGGILHHKHMVGKMLTEAELCHVGLLLRFCCRNKGNVLHIDKPILIEY